MGSSELNRPLRQMSLPATSAASSATPSTLTITTTDSDQAVSGQLALWVEFVMPGFDKEEQWNKKKDNLAVCAASILIFFY